MFLPDKKLLNKLLIILISISLLLSSSFAILKHTQNKNEQLRISALNDSFLDFVCGGDYESAYNLWPEVYTSSKNNQTFLNSFSDCLYNLYNSFYNEKYLYNNQSTESLFETSRIYFDFISIENFNKLTSSIYDQYYFENITYEIFLNAEADFAQISRFTSEHISELLNQASELHDTRESYYNAVLIAESEIPDYQTAIDMLKLIGPDDSVFYPRAIDKIDEYIIKLRDTVKNNSN